MIRGSVEPVCGDAAWNIDAAVPDEWCTKTAEGRTWHRSFPFSAASPYFTQSWRTSTERWERNDGLRGKANIQLDFGSHLFIYTILKGWFEQKSFIAYLSSSKLSGWTQKRYFEERHIDSHFSKYLLLLGSSALDGCLACPLIAGAVYFRTACWLGACETRILLGGPEGSGGVNYCRGWINHMHTVDTLNLPFTSSLSLSIGRDYVFSFRSCVLSH